MSRLTSEQRQVLKEKWQKAHDTSVPLTDPEGLSKFSYHHTKNDIDVHFIKAQSDSEIDATIVRGDVIVEKTTVEQFMSTFMSRDLKVHQETDPNTRRVEVIEEWDDEDGHWMIKYYVISAGGLYFIVFCGLTCQKQPHSFLIETFYTLERFSRRETQLTLLAQALTVFMNLHPTGFNTRELFVPQMCLDVNVMKNWTMATCWLVT